jgi:hypothetical protein
MPERGATASSPPLRARVRMYQVGFGDCFLLSLEYREKLADGRDERHVLFDFGSTHGARADAMVEVAELIRDHCHGQLDAVVATHRHADHLSGFGLATTGKVLDALEPRLVVRSWTEDPAAPEDATVPSDLDQGSRRFAAALAQSQAFAAGLGRAVRSDRGLRGDLARLAVGQLGNRAAVERLARWAGKGRGTYVHFDSDCGLQDVVPGVTVRVLGPPTLREAPLVASQRADDPEFWITQQRVLAGALPGGTLPDADGDGGAPPPVPGELGPVRWLLERMRTQHVASLLRIVRILDDALNNTSVILAIEAGDKRLLFGGDAQIENWAFALKDAPGGERIRDWLANVDLYKVGHHGSRNATPRSLHRLWVTQRDPDRPLVSMMSTLPGVHGDTPATAVPKQALLDALARCGPLYATDRLRPASRFVEVAAPLSGGEPFAPVHGEEAAADPP